MSAHRQIDSQPPKLRIGACLRRQIAAALPRRSSLRPCLAWQVDSRTSSAPGSRISSMRASNCLCRTSLCPWHLHPCLHHLRSCPCRWTTIALAVADIATIELVAAFAEAAIVAEAPVRQPTFARLPSHQVHSQPRMLSRRQCQASAALACLPPAFLGVIQSQVQPP